MVRSLSLQFRLESLVAEGEQFFPAIHRLLLTISRTIVIEKSMSGAVVAMELIIFPMLFELCFVLIDLFRRGRLIVVAKQRSEEHTSELQSRRDLVCRLLLEKKKKQTTTIKSQTILR